MTYQRDFTFHEKKNVYEFKGDKKESSENANDSSQICEGIENFDLLSAENIFCIMCVAF